MYNLHLPLLPSWACVSAHAPSPVRSKQGKWSSFHILFLVHSQTVLRILDILKVEEHVPALQKSTMETQKKTHFFVILLAQ